MKYDPEIHHRKSIRLKGHDYAGGGEYFITLCAHREFIRAAGAQCFAPFREIVMEEWIKCGQIRTGVHPGECVVMPDHFHGLIRIDAGASELGRVIGAFKAAVSRRIRMSRDGATCVSRDGATCVSRDGATCVSPVPAGRGDSQIAPLSQIAPSARAAPEMRIWLRNYYEKIIRSPEERAAIEKYIKLNPVRLIWKGSHDGCPYAAFGNPAIWEMKKIGILASGDGMEKGAICVLPLRAGWAWMSGFHSGQEQAVLAKTDAPAIRVAAVAPGQVGLTQDELHRLADGRLLVICPFEEAHTTRENALKRNRLVAEWCDKLWIPSARKGGSLETLKGEYESKLVR